MARTPGMTAIQCSTRDRDRLNQLADQLSKDGPGRFGQAETIRWLLDQRESWAEAWSNGPPQGNNPRTGIAWSE